MRPTVALTATKDASLASYAILPITLLKKAGDELRISENDLDEKRNTNRLRVRAFELSRRELRAENLA
jgi:hypothetical protein